MGRDPEIAVPRPPDVAGMLLNLLYLKGGLAELRRMAVHASGRVTGDESTYIPDEERPRVYLVARIHLCILLAFVAWSVAIGSVLPLMFVGLPSFYGAWLMIVFGVTQHAGLAEDVLDHRLNCRTIYMNPVLRFLYWNMNYHLEHHRFPMVTANYVSRRIMSCGGCRQMPPSPHNEADYRAFASDSDCASSLPNRSDSGVVYLASKQQRDWQPTLILDSQRNGRRETNPSTVFGRFVEPADWARVACFWCESERRRVGGRGLRTGRSHVEGRGSHPTRADKEGSRLLRPGCRALSHSPFCFAGRRRGRD